MDADTPGYIHTSNQDASYIHPTSVVDSKTTTAVGSTTNADVQTIAEEVRFVHPEGGWGWLVMLSAMWCNGAVFGFRNVFGILFVSLLKEFGSEDDEDLSFRTSWVGSLSFGMIFFCSPIVSVFTNILGCRVTAVGGAALALIGLLASSFVKSLGPMYFTYGVVFSTGCSFAFQPSLVILGHYFKKRLGLVNGIVTVGSSVFTVILAFVLPGLLERVGLHNTLRLLSIIMFILMLAGLTYTPLLPTRRESSSCTGSRRHPLGEVFNVNIWKSMGYRIWAFGIHIALYTYFVPFVHLMKFAEERFGPDVNKEVLLMCIGVASGVGRLVCGWAGDRIRGVNKVYLQVSSYLVVGLMSMMIPLCHTFSELIAVCLLMGLFSCFLCMISPIALELVGAADVSQAIGSMLGMMSLPITLGAPFVGFLRDRLGSYDVAFYVAGIPPIIGGAMLCLIPWVEARRRWKEELKQDTQQMLVL